jgi:predicted lipoprotein with Yx(FWY)xxD motif
MIRGLLPLAIAGVAGVGAAMAATATHTGSATVKAASRSPYGMILVSSSGKTLYRYTKDSKHVNRCTTNAVCNKYWPPLVVKGTAKPTAGAGAKSALLGTIAISHGRRQLTYAGFPLYFFAGDKKAGDVKGQSFLKQWYVVNEKGALVKHAVSSGGGGATTAATTTSTSGTTTSSWG